MKKKDYLILLLGVLLIAIFFYKFKWFEYVLTLVVIGVLVFAFLIFFFLMLREKFKLKKYGKAEVEIFSCCFIDDNVNFSRLFRIISGKMSNNNFPKTAMKFIDYLKEKDLLVKLDKQDDSEKICKEINFLLHSNGVDLKVDSSEIKDMLENEVLTFSNNLNTITGRLRKKGYELVRIYPASMYKSKEYYYFIILPIDKLLDLGEIGFLG